MRIGDWRYHYFVPFDLNAYLLIGAQMCLTGDCSGQSDAEIVAPLLDIEDSFGHV